MPLNRWSSVAIERRTVSTMAGWEWPRIALIWPEVKSSTRRPRASWMNDPLAEAATKSENFPPYRISAWSARARIGSSATFCTKSSISRCPFRRKAAEAAKPYLSNLAFSALTTLAGTKGEASPPIEAICRTSVAVIGLTGEEAGRKTVRSSGAIAPFMPAICIS